MVLELFRVDAEQALIQPELDEKVHLRLPRGRGDQPGTMLRFTKTLYGCLEILRLQEEHLASNMEHWGFQ